MKRYIHASTDIDNTAGFIFNFGNKELFYISDSKMITDKVENEAYLERMRWWLNAGK